MITVSLDSRNALINIAITYGQHDRERTLLEIRPYAVNYKPTVCVLLHVVDRAKLK